MGPSAVCMRSHHTLLPDLQVLQILFFLIALLQSPHPFSEFERVSIPCKPKSLMKTVQITSCLASGMLIIWPHRPISSPPVPQLLNKNIPLQKCQPCWPIADCLLYIHTSQAVSSISIPPMALLPQMHSLLFTLHPPGRLS